MRKRFDKMFRTSGIFKFATILFIFIVAIFLILQLSDFKFDFNLSDIFAKPPPANAVATRPTRIKCGLVRDCPKDHFAFKMASGAASVVGPRICLEDKILMSSVKNNVGRGINIALVDGKSGNLLKTASYDMWGGDVAPLIKFLKEIEDGTVVMMASFDDPATKLNDEARKLIGDLGSTIVTHLAFRDNWIFVGGKGIKTKSPFEQHIKNSADSNKFDGWPEVLEMEGCIPKKI